MNCRVCGNELSEGAIFCGECGSAVEATPYLRAQPSDPRPADTSILSGRLPGVRTAPAVPPVPTVAASALPEQGDLAEPVPTWVLAASTGERVIVAGSGLIGRRPVPQPGEAPDQLIALSDPGRSVSKTHLEFGVDAGELWIVDRFSANGTAVITPDGYRRECEPGRRYRVARGCRIDIGDQHLLIG